MPMPTKVTESSLLPWQQQLEHDRKMERINTTANITHEAIDKYFPRSVMS
jgi:hypothetical protein